jgi:cobalt-zinc-cadmium efflux system outer membrane protein
LRADAAVAVARLQAGQARADLAADHVAEVEDQLDLIRIREREGEGSRFDRLRAEQELMDARRVATSAAVVLADARSAVQALLPAGAVFDRVTDPLYTPTPPLPGDELLARADRDRADLRALAVSSDRAGLEGDLARRARRPVPTLFGGFKRADTDSGRDTGGVLGVSLSLPLFDTGAREAARWSAERQRLQAERAALLLEIRADIGRARDVLVLRQAAVSSDETPSATELVRIAEVAYREGEIGILELVDAIRTALVARLRDLDARLEARLAQIALERAVGGVLWP